MDHFIGLLVPLCKSYIRDPTHLINILNELSVQSGILLCILGLTSLYTNIPHNEDIQAMKEMLAIHRSPHDLFHSSYIVEKLTVVLTNNNFEFNGIYYHQVSGIAMGLKLASPYTNLFMTKFEEKYVQTYPLHPIIWKCFIDDIFLIWPRGVEPPHDFINHLNTTSHNQIHQ